MNDEFDKVLTQKFEHLINGILENGYAICDDFLDEIEVKNLKKQFEQRFQEGQFKAASIGKTNESNLNVEIRGDEILWLEESSSNEIEQSFLTKNQLLVNYLNQTCYLGIKKSEIHFAKYDIGKFYKRHKDSFQAQKGRVLSIIYYLNNNWKPEDGGCLIIYPQKQGIEQALEIAPIAGRLVCFESDKLAHEVAETFVQRYSITGWLLNA